MSRKVVEHKATSRRILDFKVRCGNSSVGCNWIGELRQLKKHEDETCQFNASKWNAELLQKLLFWIESYEKKLVEKVDEIIAPTKRFEGDVKNLQEQVLDLTKKVSVQKEKDSEASNDLMKDHSYANIDAFTTEIQDAQNRANENRQF